jgi:dihydrofolate reductase
MRKVILNLAVSLDGFIEGPNGEFDWCMADQDYGLMDFMNRIDSIFIVRKSYELILQMGENPYPDKLKYVFSRTLKNVGGNTKLISQNIEEEVKNIIDQDGKDIWLYGGANLVTSFLNTGLVDEIQLAVHPILLSKGKSLFKDIKERKYFKLIDTKTYSSGLVQLFYQTDKK